MVTIDLDGRTPTPGEADCPSAFWHGPVLAVGGADPATDFAEPPTGSSQFRNIGGWITSLAAI